MNWEERESRRGRWRWRCLRIVMALSTKKTSGGEEREENSATAARGRWRWEG